ncbi:hypothetical protein ABZ547_08555 [Streptomyces sparsogenes]|uniref:hypothetical protein n=1 Tax=Streptomyces sparsogenes TaxID=67365 RepID=UPI003409A3E8
MTGKSYVITVNDRPLRVAASLEAAQADAERQAAKCRETGEYKWVEHRPGEFRLQERGTRGRFAWSLYGVHVVPTVTEGGAR